MPTSITLVASETSEKLLRKFTQENKIEHKGDFHVTLLYSNSFPFFRRTRIEENIIERLPLEIKPPYNFDVFGEDSLVLRFYNSRFRDLKDFLIQEAVRQSIIEWPDLDKEEMERLREYTEAGRGKLYEGYPHITLSNNGQKYINENLYFDKPLVFDSFDWSV